MSTAAPAATSYSVIRLTVDVPASVEEFRQQYEQAVPFWPREQVDALVARGAPWSEMLKLIENAAPFGFVIYWRNDVRPVMRLAGDTGQGVFYLMGNHTIAERMFRHEPSVMLHAPLRTVLYADPDGDTKLAVDQPSLLFNSYDKPEIADVGYELDGLLAQLIELLGAQAPAQLRVRVP